MCRRLEGIVVCVELRCLFETGGWSFFFETGAFLRSGAKRTVYRFAVLQVAVGCRRKYSSSAATATRRASSTPSYHWGLWHSRMSHAIYRPHDPPHLLVRLSTTVQLDAP
jgi:hypothetical protein